MAVNGFSRLSNPTMWAAEMALSIFDLDEAVRLLRENFPVRKKEEVLDIAVRQRAQELETTEAAVRADLELELGQKKLARWLTSANLSKEEAKETAICIAFGLKMTYEEAEKFLKKCWLDGFYMRDVRDVIYRHGLKNEWDYDSVTEIIERFHRYNIGNPAPADGDSAQREYTKEISAQASSARTKEELEEVIKQNKDFFGSFRRRTYERFVELYKELEKEWKDVAGMDHVLDASLCEQDDEQYEVSMEELCDVIVKGIPEMRERGLDTVIRRCIAKHIPSRTGMSEIINKSVRYGKIAEVDRKLFMLAWLASEEDGSTKRFFTGDENAEIDFQEHIIVFNELLRIHGMAELDARHPFDWIVMNSIRCGYIVDKEKKNEWIDDIEGRMQSLIENM